MQQEPLKLAAKLLETIGDTDPVTAFAALSVARELFDHKQRIASKNKTAALLNSFAAEGTGVLQESELATG